MKQLLISKLFLLIVIVFTTCQSDSGSSISFNHVDTVLEEVFTSENIEEVESAVIGNKIDFVNAGYFLSRMLKQVAYESDYSDSSSIITIKTLSNRNFSPNDFPQDFTPEYERIRIGSFTQGFGALKWAFLDPLYNAEQLYQENTFAAAIKNLSGLELTQKTDIVQPFKYINPDAIKWCWQNFYRIPTTSSVTDVSLSTLYDIVFKKFVRTLWVSHQQLVDGNFENEKKWYSNSIIIEKKDAQQLLGERYSMPDKYSKEGVNAPYYPSAIGFWIRRSMDGTEDLIWNYLRTLIMDYDYAWGCKNFNICDRG